VWSVIVAHGRFAFTVGAVDEPEVSTAPANDLSDLCRTLVRWGDVGEM
jgi:hypothetical protein